MRAKPLRIGVDAHVLTGKYQGTRTTLTSLLRALGPQIGDRDVLVYAEDTGAARAAIGSERLQYRDLPGSGPVSRLLRTFPKLFGRDGVTIGVFQYIAPLTGKNLVFVHDVLPITHPGYFPFLTRLRVRLFFTLSVRRAAMVLTVSEDARRAIERVYRLPPGRLRTVVNGPSFPPEAYAGSSVPGMPPYLLTVGRIEQRKNIPLLVDAFRRADLPDVRLVVVGTPDLGFHWTPPEDPRIDWRGSVSEQELIELYRGASLFVYPSAAEGFGIPLLDATLFGLPVITSDRTAMPEVGGNLVEYFDPEADGAVDALARRIAGHFGDRPVRRPDEAERAAQADRFSWDRAATAFLQAVDACVAREAGR